MDKSKIFIGNRPKPDGEIFPRYIERGVGFFSRRVYHWHGTQLVRTVYMGSNSFYMGGNSFDFSGYCEDFRAILRNIYPQLNP